MQTKKRGKARRPNICKYCGIYIDELYRKEYICKSCYNENHKKYMRKNSKVIKEVKEIEHKEKFYSSEYNYNAIGNLIDKIERLEKYI